ncbi:Germ cell-specific gene 1-like protein [Liparis tanakae]|uniref:Germ cell-specific gene 1-like protein n=1 Tax=Liparis tanakae TaxID=230148 RepID=A0A4Z2G4P9_9TELE|nr:Germ cell-specific gene 1-like protein [Liparis tanakae]
MGFLRQLRSPRLSFVQTVVSLFTGGLALMSSYWCEGRQKVPKPLCSPVKLSNCIPVPGVSNSSTVQFSWETGDDRFVFPVFHTGLFLICEEDIYADAAGKRGDPQCTGENLQLRFSALISDDCLIEYVSVLSSSTADRMMVVALPWCFNQHRGLVTGQKRRERNIWNVPHGKGVVNGWKTELVKPPRFWHLARPRRIFHGAEWKHAWPRARERRERAAKRVTLESLGDVNTSGQQTHLAGLELNGRGPREELVEQACRKSREKCFYGGREVRERRGGEERRRVFDLLLVAVRLFRV